MSYFHFLFIYWWITDLTCHIGQKVWAYISPASALTPLRSHVSAISMLMRFLAFYCQNGEIIRVSCIANYLVFLKIHNLNLALILDFSVLTILFLNCLRPVFVASTEAHTYIHKHLLFNQWLPVITVWFSHYSTLNSLSVPFGSLPSQVGCR